MSLEVLVLIIVSNVALWYGAGLIACRLLHGSWDRLLATAVLGWSILIVALQVLSQFGQMRLAVVAIAVTAFLIVALAVLFVRPRTCHNPIDTSATGSHLATTSTNRRGLRRFGLRRSENAIAWMPAAVTLMLALGAGLYHLWRGLVLPVEPVSDAPIYHLYFAVRWYHAGRIEWVATPFGELAATYFPSNGGLWFCWLVMAVGSEAFAKVGQWPFWLLGGMVIYTLARKSGTSRRAAIFPAAFWATGSSILLQGAGLANVDLISAAWYLIAVYFLVRFAETSRATTPDRPRKIQADDSGSANVVTSHARAWFQADNEAPELVANATAARSVFVLLFGLAAGAAVGTHATALFFAPLLVAPAVWLVVFGDRRWRHLMILTVGLVIPSAYWYARNWVTTGNPVYPVQVDILDVPVFSGWYEPSAMRRSNYHIPAGDLAALAERCAAVIDVRGSFLLRAWRDSRMNLSWTAAALCAAHLSAWLLGILWALAEPFVARREPGESAVRQRSRLNWFLVLLGITHVAVYWWLVPYQSQQRFLFPAAALTVVPLARLLERRYWLQAMAGAVLAAHLSLPIWPGSLDRGFGRAPHPWQTVRDAFYPTRGFAANLYPAWQALDEQRPPEGARVAYAGTNLPYYLFGPGMHNRVLYVNVNEHAEFLPHDYHRARTAKGETSLASDPWPEWHRDHSDYGAWLANLRRAEIDLLFVARENQHGRPDAVIAPPLPIEFRWARAHPASFDPIPVGAAPGMTEPWAYVFRVRKADP